MQLTMDRAALVGQSLERIEDAALLSGRGAYMDDLGVKPGTLHAAILRSPHAHADIVSIRTEPARALPGVFAVMSGPDLAAKLRSLRPGIKVLLMSAFTSGAIHDHGIQIAPGEAILVKPFTVVALSTKLRILLKHQSPFVRPNRR